MAIRSQSQRRPQGRPAQPELSPELVVQAAIRLADERGVDALALRGVADLLGVHPTSIYNHLPNKAAVFDGVIEALLIEAQLPLAVPDWASWVREFAGAIRRTARLHPGAFGVFLRHAGTGPTAARHMEAALDAFRRAGCSVEQAARAVHGVSLAILGLALEEGPVAPPVVAPDLSHLSAADYPRIAEVETAGVLDSATDLTWDIVVEGLIAGLAVTLPIQL